MSLIYSPTVLRSALDLLIGATETVLRQEGTPLQRGRKFLLALEDERVIQMMGHGHPYLVEAQVTFQSEGGEGDRAIREALASLFANRIQLPSPTPTQAPPSTVSSPPAPELTTIGIVRWRLFVAVPLRSWCSPFARLWHLRKLARVGLLIVAAGLLGIAGFTLGWLPALGTVAAGLVVAVAAAAILPRREPPGTAL